MTKTKSPGQTPGDFFFSCKMLSCLTCNCPDAAEQFDIFFTRVVVVINANKLLFDDVFEHGRKGFDVIDGGAQYFLTFGFELFFGLFAKVIAVGHTASLRSGGGPVDTGNGADDEARHGGTV